MNLTRDQFQQELRKMVASPAWAELPTWFTEVMVRRVMRTRYDVGDGPMHVAHKAAGDVAGALVLMLAIENEINGDRNASTTRIVERVERAAQAGGAGTGRYSRHKQRSDAAGGQTNGAGSSSTG